MKSWLSTLAGPALWLLALLTAPVRGSAAQESEDSGFEDPTVLSEPEMDWQIGPTRGRIGDQAAVEVPESYRLLEERETVRLLEMMGNPTSGRELATLAPAGSLDWMVFFEFDDAGYVKDDDREVIEDSDALLKSIREGTEASNEVRRERGWPTMEIVGWKLEPRYNESTQNLEWAIDARAHGPEGSPPSPVLNHNIRLLGREGVMEVSLVCDPDQYQESLAECEKLLQGFEYVQGRTYAEYRAGDKIAEYGLAALVTSGAAAVAFKTGLFKKFGKLLIVVVVAVAAFFKKLWARLTGRVNAPSADPNE